MDLNAFLFYRRRRQYPEREEKFRKLLQLAEFLEFQSQYFPMDSNFPSTAIYRKTEPRWFYFKVPLTGNKKNKLLYRKLEEFSRETNLYVEVVPINVWDRRTLIRVQLSRELLDTVNMRQEKYVTTLDHFCDELKTFLGYEEWEKTEYYDQERKEMVVGIRKTYPPEKGKEDD